MGKYYLLINPYVEGSFKKIYYADNSLKAAEKCYKNLSQHFTNSVKKFQFTLLKLNSSDITKGQKSLDLTSYLKKEKINKLKNENFSHFMVMEKLKGNEVNYSINSLEHNLETDHIDNLTSDIIKIQNKYKKNIDAKYKKKKFSKKKSKKSKKRKDSSEDSDSDSDSESSDSYKYGKTYNSLLWYWYYNNYYPYYYYYSPMFAVMPTQAVVVAPALAKKYILEKNNLELDFVKGVDDDDVRNDSD